MLAIDPARGGDAALPYRYLPPVSRACCCSQYPPRLSGPPRWKPGPSGPPRGPPMPMGPGPPGPRRNCGSMPIGPRFMPPGPGPMPGPMPPLFMPGPGPMPPGPGPMPGPPMGPRFIPGAGPMPPGPMGPRPIPPCGGPRGAGEPATAFRDCAAAGKGGGEAAGALGAWRAKPGGRSVALCKVLAVRSIARSVDKLHCATRG